LRGPEAAAGRPRRLGGDPGGRAGSWLSARTARAARSWCGATPR